MNRIGKRTLSAGILGLFIFIGCIGKESDEVKLPRTQPDLRLPQALILATSDGDGLGTVSDGALLAYEALNRRGVPARIMSRTILADSIALERYGIIVASTLYGYHDADRRYSLTYMDDDQIRLLKDWAAGGGILIAGENFARNTREGYDRILDSGRLDSAAWLFSEAVGAALAELDLNGYSLAADSEHNLWDSGVKTTLTQPGYTLVPAQPSDSLNITISAEWGRCEEAIPAVWVNRFGEGLCYYFTSFRLLHPSQDGGLASPEEIERFYQAVGDSIANRALSATGGKFSLSIPPWPGNRPAALALTLNCRCDEDGLFELIQKLTDAAGALTIFAQHPQKVQDSLPSPLREKVEIASLSRTDLVLTDLERGHALEMIHIPQREDFSLNGFRFPRLARNYALLERLDRLGYLYESSLTVNHIEYYQGSLFPLRLNLAGEECGAAELNLLEIGPIYRDDWSFYHDRSRGAEKNASLYQQFLLNLWEDVFLPGKGAMVQIGDPLFQGSSDTLLQPVIKLAARAAEDGAWITTLADIAEYWNARENAEVEVWSGGSGAVIAVEGKGRNLEGFTIALRLAPEYAARRIRWKAQNAEVNQSGGDTLFIVCGAGERAGVKLNF